MAQAVLTTATAVTCPHGSAITFTSDSALRIDGMAVVRTSDLTGAVFACAAQTKCNLIKKSSAATALEDGDAAVVLAAGLETNIGPATIAGAETLLTAE